MPKSIHHSYLLRLWREQEGAPMRATLVAVARPEERPRLPESSARHATGSVTNPATCNPLPIVLISAS